MRIFQTIPKYGNIDVSLGDGVFWGVGVPPELMSLASADISPTLHKTKKPYVSRIDLPVTVKGMG